MESSTDSIKIKKLCSAAEWPNFKFHTLAYAMSKDADGILQGTYKKPTPPEPPTSPGAILEFKTDSALFRTRNGEIYWFLVRNVSA